MGCSCYHHRTLGVIHGGRRADEVNGVLNHTPEEKRAFSRRAWVTKLIYSTFSLI